MKDVTKEIWKDRKYWGHITDDRVRNYGYMMYDHDFILKIGDRWATLKQNHISIILTGDIEGTMKEIFSDYIRIFSDCGRFFLTNNGFLVETMVEVPEEILEEKSEDYSDYYAMFLYDLRDCKFCERAGEGFEFPDPRASKNCWVFDSTWHLPSHYYLPLCLNTNVYTLDNKPPRLDMSKLTWVAERGLNGYFVADDGKFGYIFSRRKAGDIGFHVRFFYMKDMPRITDEDWEWANGNARHF